MSDRGGQFPRRRHARHVCELHLRFLQPFFRPLRSVQSAMYAEKRETASTCGDEDHADVGANYPVMFVQVAFSHDKLAADQYGHAAAILPEYSFPNGWVIPVAFSSATARPLGLAIPPT